MSINAELTGNVLQTPVLKPVTVNGGETKMVAQLRIMSSFLRRQDDGSLSQVDSKTFPVDVTVWHEGYAQQVVKHLKVGASVRVTGQLFVNPWLDNDGKAQAGVRIDAESVSLNLTRVEQVQFRPRQPRNGDESGGSQRTFNEFPTDMDHPAHS